MKKDLLIALRRHKRVIVIFLLTIFVPSVLLSVLGVRAIRNERFRLANQLEEEQIRIVDLFRTQILSQINEVENSLQNLVQTPSLINRDYEAINILLDSRLDENNLLKQFFVVYRNAGPWFPPLQPVYLYKQILEEFPDNREVAAKSLLHMGICYEKQGLKQARGTYQDVINKYPDRQ